MCGLDRVRCRSHLKLQIRSPAELLSRPLARLDNRLRGFIERSACGRRALIRVSRGGKTMDGKSIMGILLLAAPAGSSVTISADGVDESDAIDALCRLVEGGFGEELWNA